LLKWKKLISFLATVEEKWILSIQFGVSMWIKSIHHLLLSTPFFRFDAPFCLKKMPMKNNIEADKDIGLASLLSL
jgi:hypothetical protein